MAEEIKDTQEQPEETTPASEETKTFTQDEVDQIVADRVARERKKLPTDVDLKKYREWMKNSQTDAEKYSAMEAELNASRAELTAIKNQQALLKAECKPEFAEIVAEKIARMDGDFMQNLTAYKKANPHLFGTQQSATKLHSSSPSLSGGGSSDTKPTNKFMNDLIRGSRR